MAYKKLRQGSGSPKLCWHCGKQLQRAPGKGLGLFYFHLVTCRDGFDHRVHGDCLDDVLGDGVKLKEEA